MGFFNFPNTRTYDTDLGWLIKKYQDLTAEYSSLAAWKTTHESEYAELKKIVDILIQNMAQPVEAWDGTKAYLRYTLVDYQGTTYIALQDVPAGVLITNTDYWAEAQTILTEINAIKTDLETVETSAAENAEKLDLMTSEIVTIKAADSTIDGFPYGGFSGGCVFAGRELYAFRAAPEHRTDENSYGKIVFFERKKGNQFEKLDLELLYDAVTYGECRDPNLSVSRDGNRLYVSVFTSFSATGTTHNSIVFVFNKNLTQIGYSVIDNAIFWGNTLETPSGYLLHMDYAGNTLTLYKSTQPITDANAGAISWTSLTPFTLTGGRTYAEPTLGYFNNRLVMITRTGGAYSSEIAYTFNLEGESGWTQNATIGENLHAPALLPYCSGNYMPCSASIVNAAITGDASYRMPYMCLISFANNRTSSASGVAIEIGGLIAPADQLPTFGGYTTLVRLRPDAYGIMFYGDTGTDNMVAFIEIELYRSYVNMTYTDLDDTHNIIFYSTYGKTAYNKSIIDWCVAALSGSNYGYIIFTSTTSASDITDKPTGLISNFSGSARRVSTQYYIDVFFEVSGVMKHASISGTAANISAHTWTIV